MPSLMDTVVSELAEGVGALLGDPMFYCAPDIKHVRLLIVYADRHGMSGGYASHEGLGVGAAHSVRSLRKHNVWVQAVSVGSASALRLKLQAQANVTHCLVEAMWLTTAELRSLVTQFPSVHFIIRSHSQVGFLQVESGALLLLREQLMLQEQVMNFTFSSNTRKLAAFIEQVYSHRCLVLPNLYESDRPSIRRHEAHNHRLLRIGSFGALRVLKNHTTALAAAMEIAVQRHSDLEFHVNSNREEHGKGILQSMRNMALGVPWLKLVEVPWTDWSAFRHTVRHMDLCLQPSFTETFNLVTADAAAENVPSVVSTAIEWVPNYWKADADSVADVARTGSQLLSYTSAGEDGQLALYEHGQAAIRTWMTWLASNPTL